MNDKTINQIEKIIEAVMVFVLNKNRQILLLKRIDNLKWEPVKGGIHIGESFDEAAIRELQEETGIISSSKPVLLDVVNDVLDTAEGKSTKIHGHVVTVEIDNNTPIILGSGEHKEHSEFRWVNLELLMSEELYPPIANKMLKVIVGKLN